MTSNVHAKIPVMEVFGPTIQGEGMVIGRKTMFVRTGGCDYSCSWCDSAFTWNGEEKATMLTGQELFDKVLGLGSPMEGIRNFDHITISGGNPALIGAGMEHFINICRAEGIDIGLETQGTRWQDWFYKIDDLTISPKPPSSGMKTDWYKLRDILEKLEDAREVDAPYRFSLKVVVFDDADYEFAQQMHVDFPDIPFYLSVGNENAKEDGDISSRLITKLDWLWNKVLADPIMNDARPLPQLHTIVWANKRGV